MRVQKKNRKETNIDFVTAWLQESPGYLTYSALAKGPFFSAVLKSGLVRFHNLPMGQGHRQKQHRPVGFQHSSDYR